MSRTPTSGVTECDVAICGGGLAGLTLARQLRQQIPELSIAVIDKLRSPLPEATCKVGESTVELGAHYLAETLKLGPYLENAHLQKLGLRFFFGDPAGCFADRPEFGLSQFPVVTSYQIDRGILENDLRRFNADAGISMLEGCRVHDVVLTDGDRHEVIYENGHNGPRRILTHWVIDAMGRRRFLQRKLKLTKERPNQKFSASWFRMKGRVDVADLVHPENQSWHSRVPNNNRYYSTNHLMGNGYWVWLIALPSHNTSLGIVALEDMHPFAEFNTYKSALQWIRTHEPALASCIENREPLDFRVMRRYSYSSQQLFSIDRWACVGEAGIFSDAFYSIGTDLIGFANCVTTEMIRLDHHGTLREDIVKGYDQFVRALNDQLTCDIQLGYPFFGNAVVMAAKLIWDIPAAWAFLCPQMFNSIFLDRETHVQLRQATARFFSLTQRMQRLFREWDSRSPGRCSYKFIDYLAIPFLKKLRASNLRGNKSTEELLEDRIANMERFEELAQVLFLLAVEDIEPECLDRLPSPTWLNAWSVSLNSEKWEADGLFKPISKPRDLYQLREEIRSLFRFDTFSH